MNNCNNSNFNSNNERGQENDDQLPEYFSDKPGVINGYSQYQRKQNRIEHLRSAVDNLKWDKVSGRHKKDILQAHIDKYAKLKLGVEAWHLSARDAVLATGISRKSLMTYTNELCEDKYLKKLPTKGRMELEFQSPARTFGFGRNTLALLQKDVDVVAKEDIKIHAKHYNITKSKKIDNTVSAVLIALSRGFRTITTIAAEIGAHRDTVSKAVKTMELYSLAFRVGRYIYPNPDAKLEQIAIDHQTIFWVEDTAIAHTLEREEFKNINCYMRDLQRALEQDRLDGV